MFWLFEGQRCADHVGGRILLSVGRCWFLSELGLGLVTGHASLARGFLGATLADFVDAGGQDLVLLETFVVLGDPILRLIDTLPRNVFLPLVLRWATP